MVPRPLPPPPSPCVFSHLIHLIPLPLELNGPSSDPKSLSTFPLAPPLTALARALQICLPFHPLPPRLCLQSCTRPPPQFSSRLGMPASCLLPMPASPHPWKLMVPTRIITEKPVWEVMIWNELRHRKSAQGGPSSCWGMVL